ncbi:hypothetical protein ACH5RR_038277 [Cinchona calisaya]|uniref:Uncharacterized protein n=1 Tax=Cinchona calisaya TaxID=153742 RepID=A0ABD2XUU3_9GENT
MDMDTTPNWMTPVIQYLKEAKLPEDKIEAQRVERRSSKYLIIEETLYQRFYSMPYLQCLSLSEAKYVLMEVHERGCGHHVGGRALVQKVRRLPLVGLSLIGGAEDVWGVFLSNEWRSLMVELEFRSRSPS